MLTKSPSHTLADQLCARFADRIKSRLLAPGARLPSVRQCAQQQQVSPSAYDQLLALGLVGARKNKGFFVREFAREGGAARTETASENPTDAKTSNLGKNSTVAGVFTHQLAINNIAHKNLENAITEPIARPVNAAMLIRGMFHQTNSKPQPGMGVFPPDWLASSFLSAAVLKVTGTVALNKSSLQYGEPMGDKGLRQSLSNKLALPNITAAPEQIITTVGPPTPWIL